MLHTKTKNKMKTLKNYYIGGITLLDIVSFAILLTVVTGIILTVAPLN